MKMKKSGPQVSHLATEVTAFHKDYVSLVAASEELQEQRSTFVRMKGDLAAQNKKIENFTEVLNSTIEKQNKRIDFLYQM